MTTETYIIRQPRCDDLVMACDMGNPCAPIQYEGDSPDEWVTTPFQTADAQHEVFEAARLACDYAGWPFGEDEDGNPIPIRIISR